MADRLRVGIVGVSGYTGTELVRLVFGHPRLELAAVFARDNAGRRLGEVLPAVEGMSELSERVIEALEPADAASVARRIDVAFTALPHGKSAVIGRSLLEAGVRVVDLSADFRLRDRSVYEQTYGAHEAPELLSKAVYGLPELYRAELSGAQLIAAPGCYPTSAILPLAPLIAAKLVHADGIIIDSKSGVSGAGRTPGTAYHYPEAAEGLRPYKVAGAHRHIPEIEQALSERAGSAVTVVFTPQLVPMNRGILTIAYARPRERSVSVRTLREAALKAYDRGLVSVLPEGRLPDTLWVRGSARAHVAYAVDERAGVVLAMCAIDNLARGASAQAIQALNVALGWRDELGLPCIAVFP
jgi:N-acetyl-gamma-glutamyl-phosphate reductase